MSSFAQSPTLADAAWPGPQAASRRLAHRVCQAMVLLPLFSLMLLPEYVQGVGDPETKSLFYLANVGPFRLVDGLLLGVVLVHLVGWTSSRRLRVNLPGKLALPGIGFVAAILMAIIYGGLHDGTNLFFDWRALALGAGLFVVFALWSQTAEDARFAIVMFAGFMAVRIAVICLDFFRGGGDVLVGVRIPVFDGPTLSAIVFTAVLALGMTDVASRRWHKLSWILIGAAACLLVLLCFRRTFWAELGVAIVLLLWLQPGRRWRKLLLGLAVLVTAATLLGPAFFDRMQSMDFTSGESEFSQGNPDHVGEVQDSWEAVRQRPVMGIGLGRSFPTLRIQGWKEESVMVHNAPLHVWLKYGLLGLVCYLWLHLAMFRWLYRRVSELRHLDHTPTPRGLKSARLVKTRCLYGTAEAVPFQNAGESELIGRLTTSANASVRGLTPEACWAGAALAYLAATFIVSLGFTPWPYSSLQSATLIAFILAVAVTGATSCNFPRSR